MTPKPPRRLAQIDEAKDKPTRMRCNGCDKIKPDTLPCERCNCPEFRVEVLTEKGT